MMRTSAFVYAPVQAGSIDGTDTIPHDHAVVRAMTAKYDPGRDAKIDGDPYCTLYVGRLSYDTTEETLRHIFSAYGKIKRLRLVRHVVTGQSRGYAFIEYDDEYDFRAAFKATNHMIVDGRQILVDYERERVMKGWIPRRLGGGLGGRKESGQLRFGGRDRPFKAPLRYLPSANQGSAFMAERDKLLGRSSTHERDRAQNQAAQHDRDRERDRDWDRDRDRDRGGSERDRSGSVGGRDESRERDRDRDRDRGREYMR